MKPEYAVAGKDKHGWNSYLSKDGLPTFMLNNAAIFRSIPEAENAAVLLSVKVPELIGTIKIHKIKVVKGARISREL